jgi:hypothetical protein
MEESLSGRNLKFTGASYKKSMDGKSISLNGKPHTLTTIKASDLKHGHLVYDHKSGTVLHGISGVSTRGDRVKITHPPGYSYHLKHNAKVQVCLPQYAESTQSELPYIRVVKKLDALHHSLSS